MKKTLVVILLFFSFVTTSYAQAFSINANSPLSIDSYDGSGQLVHPDVVMFDSPWNGFKYWMMVTPFPDSNDDYENPSIYASKDGLKWVVPNGAVNPVIPAVSSDGLGPLNSDPDMFFEDGKLKLVYRYWNNADPNSLNKIMYSESSNGVNWSTPTVLFEVSKHALSPSVIKVNGEYWMYTVGRELTSDINTYWVEKRTSLDFVDWSEPVKVKTDLPKTVRPWHIDVNWDGKRVEMLLNTNAPNEHKPNALYLLQSTDTEDFFVALNNKKSLITPSKSGWDNYYIYRGSFVKHPDGKYQIWYSGRNVEGKYRVGYVEGDFEFGFNGSRYEPDKFNNTVIGSNWEKGHLVLGAYHIWIDANGNLRVKYGAPTSDMDGKVVGYQV